MSSGTGTPYFPSGYQAGYAAAQTQEVPPKPESPKPPKKPLTPYMRFSTSVRFFYLCKKVLKNQGFPLLQVFDNPIVIVMLCVLHINASNGLFSVNREP